jgi:REP element-mobilizing transposase RayT
MTYDPEIHHRRSIRLRGYDYSLPGAYYVTVCAFEKKCIFGSIVEQQMRENECGAIVREQWFESARKRREIELDAFVIMPNHLHGILWIVGPIVGPSGARPDGSSRIRAGSRGPLGPTRAPQRGTSDRAESRGSRVVPPMEPRSLASWAAGFKAAVTSRIRRLWDEPNAPVWQEDYYEHIIRDEAELNRIREYISTNPLRWGTDRYNPERTAPLEGEDVDFDFDW